MLLKKFLRQTLFAVRSCIIDRQERQNFRLGTHSSPEETSSMWEDEIFFLATASVATELNSHTRLCASPPTHAVVAHRCMAPTPKGGGGYAVPFAYALYDRTTNGTPAWSLTTSRFFDVHLHGGSFALWVWTRIKKSSGAATEAVTIAPSEHTRECWVCWDPIPCTLTAPLFGSFI